jgi:hypothetical protein
MIPPKQNSLTRAFRPFLAAVLFAMIGVGGVLAGSVSGLVTLEEPTPPVRVHLAAR